MVGLNGLGVVGKPDSPAVVVVCPGSLLNSCCRYRSAPSQLGLWDFVNRGWSSKTAQCAPYGQVHWGLRAMMERCWLPSKTSVGDRSFRGPVESTRLRTWQGPEFVCERFECFSVAHPPPPRGNFTPFLAPTVPPNAKTKGMRHTYRIGARVGRLPRRGGHHSPTLPNEHSDLLSSDVCTPCARTPGLPIAC